MSFRTSLTKERHSPFWAGFFYVLGVGKNPFYNQAREVLKKSAEDRIAESLEQASINIKEAFDKEIYIIDEAQ
jgi:hypothetical protein